jgi:hypothetical protein
VVLSILPFVGILAFGHGLGDIVYAGAFVFCALGLLLANFLTRQNRTRQRYLIILAFFLPALLFFIYEASWGRGGEYAWNGNFFFRR